jgi:hypothetical protein
VLNEIKKRYVFFHSPIMKHKNQFEDDNSMELTRQLHELGLKMLDIDGDGNCMFRAISDQLFGVVDNHLEIRKKICEHILKNVDLYQVFVEESFSGYCDRMGKPGVYGGNLELVAASRVFKVGIAIHQAAQEIWFISDNPNHDRVIHLAYHSWEHYSSIRSIKSTRNGVPSMVLKSSKPTSNGKKSWERNSSDSPTNMERKILNQMQIGLEKLEYIRELLEKYRGDPTKVLDQLYEEHEQELEVRDVKIPDSPTNNDLADIDCSVPEEIAISIPKVPEEEPWPVVKPKKISKREKKESKRREKMSRNKKKMTTESVTEAFIADVKILSI